MPRAPDQFSGSPSKVAWDRQTESDLGVVFEVFSGSFLGSFYGVL